jgi:hypothetical protein
MLQSFRRLPGRQAGFSMCGRGGENVKNLAIPVIVALSLSCVFAAAGYAYRYPDGAIQRRINELGDDPGWFGPGEGSGQYGIPLFDKISYELQYPRQFIYGNMNISYTAGAAILVSSIAAVPLLILVIRNSAALRYLACLALAAVVVTALLSGALCIMGLLRTGARDSGPPAWLGVAAIAWLAFHLLLWLIPRPRPR